MVMDVYHAPRYPREDDIYLLELFKEENGLLHFTSDDYVERLLGVFETLEAALHAMDHNKNYENSDLCGGCHLCVSSVRRNRARICRNTLVSWEYESSSSNGPEKHGKFTLHDGLRTHKVEDYK